MSSANHSNQRAAGTPHPSEQNGAARRSAPARLTSDILPRRPSWMLGAIGGLLVSLSSARALAQEQPPPPTPDEDKVAACLSSHTEGQELRQNSKLLESRDAFRLCSAAECPNQIIRDCGEWLEQVQRQIPSFSLRITADGASRADAKVYLDGAPIEKLSGKAVDVNPGVHRLRVTLPPFEPYESELVISDGEQFRVVEVAFRTPPSEILAPTRQEPTPQPIMHRPVPVATYVFAGLTAAAAVSGAGWGLSSWSLRRELEASCAPRCTDQGVDVLKQRALLTDISWGVGAASLITAVTFYVFRPEKPLDPEAVEVDVSWLPSGGALGTVSVAGF